MTDLTRARDYFRGQADQGDEHADLWTRLADEIDDYLNGDQDTPVSGDDVQLDFFGEVVLS